MSPKIAFVYVLIPFKASLLRVISTASPLPGRGDDENSMNHAKGVTQRWLKNHCKKVVKRGYKYTLYTSPDGKEGSYGYFMREVDKGYLHGLTCRV